MMCSLAKCIVKWVVRVEGSLSAGTGEVPLDWGGDLVGGEGDRLTDGVSTQS